MAVSLSLVCWLKQLMLEKGIKFHSKTSASEFIGSNGKLKEVILKDGTTLPAELCVAGIGNFIYHSAPYVAFILSPS